jgi:hypothetical protein
MQENATVGSAVRLPLSRTLLRARIDRVFALRYPKVRAAAAARINARMRAVRALNRT